MLNPKDFIEILRTNNTYFFCGVPDSLIKDFCAYIEDNVESQIITANEGNAIAMGSGYYLSNNKIPLVYMQNSGLGNCINPLLSLCDKSVYSIPMLLLIGWRGQPGVKDEPQHKKQGEVTTKLLDAIDVPHEILSDNFKVASQQIAKAYDYMKSEKSPYALIVKKGTFKKYSKLSQNIINDKFDMTREMAIKIIADNIEKDSIIVSTTGMTSRELYEHREFKLEGHEKDFLTVGSMGHSSSIAYGITFNRPDLKVYCLDGDGACLMHMGSLAVIAEKSPTNLYHILLNNGAHDSVGGQETVGLKTPFYQIAKDCGYKNTYLAETQSELESKLTDFINSTGPSFIEVRVKLGNRKDLSRPNESPVENKEKLMQYISSNMD